MLDIVDALKLVGKIMVFKLAQFWNTEPALYTALPEHAAGKYTFCKFWQNEKQELKSTAVPAAAGDGNDVNLTHCNE